MSLENDVTKAYIDYYPSKSGLNYTNLFYFEKKFFDDEYVESKRVWMSQYWNMSIVYAFIYVVVIYLGQVYMRSREKYDLRRALVAWNFVLATFSIVGTIRVWPDFLAALYTKGLTWTMCSIEYAHGVTGCWAWLFILSKLPELGDTVFIVLRKQELIFLHWYHHATVLVYCWFSGRDFSASGRLFMIMNYTVHSVMYTYYGFRALRFKIPKWINVAITTGQLSQMVVGIYINCVAYYQKSIGARCDVSDENIKWSSIMYFTYFLLFFQFFYQAYVSKPKNAKSLTENGNGHVKTNGIKNGSMNGENSSHVNGFQNGVIKKKV